MQCSSIDSKPVVFSEHALTQFNRRFLVANPKSTLKNPERTARKLLNQAKEDGAINPVGKVRRLINNHFQEARYFLIGSWRFVLKEEDGLFTVLTIEIDRFVGR